MNHQLKPCRECPFKNTSLKGYLGGFSNEETKSIALSESVFECHLTRETGNEKHCAGRFLFAKKSCKSFRDEELESIKNEVVNLNPNYKEEILAVWEFDKHHTL